MYLPPVRLRVAYTATELQKAGNDATRLRLMHYLPDGRQWEDLNAAVSASPALPFCASG